MTVLTRIGTMAWVAASIWRWHLSPLSDDVDQFLRLDHELRCGALPVSRRRRAAEFPNVVSRERPTLAAGSEPKPRDIAPNHRTVMAGLFGPAADFRTWGVTTAVDSKYDDQHAWQQHGCGIVLLTALAPEPTP